MRKLISKNKSSSIDIIEKINSVGLAFYKINSYKIVLSLRKICNYHIDKWGALKKGNSVFSDFRLKWDSRNFFKAIKEENYNILFSVKLLITTLLSYPWRFFVKRYILNMLSREIDFNYIISTFIKKHHYKHIFTSVDTYRTPASLGQVIPWHRDGSFTKEFISNGSDGTLPKDTLTLKFFIFLSPKTTYADKNKAPLSSLSVIPNTANISRFLDRLVILGDIPRTDNWSLDMVRNLAKSAQQSQCKCSKEETLLLKNFLSATENCSSDPNVDTTKYDLPNEPGSVVIFDDYSLHRGSPTGTLNSRLVLRVIVLLEKSECILRNTRFDKIH